MAGGADPEAFDVFFHPLQKWLRWSVSSPKSGEFVAIIADISQRKEMEAILSLSQLSLDCSADMIHWLTPEGKIVYVNESCMGRLGYTHDELLEMTIMDVDGGLDADEWDRRWRLLKKQGSASRENMHRTKNGELFPVEVTTNYVSSGDVEYNCCFVRDISERRRLEASLRLTQLSVDQAADLIYWIGADGAVLYVSDSVISRLGFTREELLGMTIFDIDPQRNAHTFSEEWDGLRKIGTQTFESINRTKTGEVFPVEISSNYVRQDGKEYNFAYCRDITERKQAEQQLRQAKAELEGRNRELEDISRRLRNANKQLVEIQDALVLQARTDALTGSLNRGAVLARLDDEIARASRTGSSLAVGIIDVDHFKVINDTYGHPVGDRVLCEVVVRSLGALRPYDVFGRFGGEEFLIIVLDVKAQQAREIFDRVRRAIGNSPIMVDETGISVTVSIGGVVQMGESAETLIHMADKALYAAKDGGRNLVVMAEAETVGEGVVFVESPRSGSDADRARS